MARSSIRVTLIATLIKSFLCGFVFIYAPQAPASSAQCEVLFKTIAVKTISPLEAEVLNHFRARGLNPEQIRVRVIQIPRPRVLFTYAGTPIASAELQKFPNGIHEGHIYVNDIRVNLERSRQGVGTLVYLILAREAHKAGYVLESGWDPTRDARAVWQSFVSKGWAYNVDHFFVRFKTDFLEDPSTQASIDGLVERFR